MRFLTAIAFTSLGMLILCSQESKASIGEVILHEGSGVIERKDNGESVENILSQLRNQNTIQITATLAYYLNNQRSNTTLLGITSISTPNQYTARNILI